MKRASAISTLDIAIWVGFVGLSLVAIVFVLIPFYMTGGNVPSLEPGWYPDKDYEFASIATYRGTIWENNTFLQEMFWRVGYFGCCFWLPLMLVTVLELGIRRESSSRRGQQLQRVALICSIVIGALWAIAILRMFDITRD